jgi:hypothetical protein
VEYTKPYTVDLRGHFGLGKVSGGELAAENHVISERMQSALSLVFDIDPRFKSLRGIAGRVAGEDYLTRLSLGCFHCGKEVTVERVGQKKSEYQTSTDCVSPRALRPFDVKLQVRSGKIVFANDMRDFIGREARVKAENAGSIESVVGIKKVIKSFEKEGLVHFLVGNSCPSIYQRKDGSLRVAPDALEGAKKVGWVCTDLWWVSAMDFNVAKILTKRFGIERDSKRETIVRVKKGTWAFRFDPTRGCDFKFCDVRLVKE